MSSTSNSSSSGSRRARTDWLTSWLLDNLKSSEARASKKEPYTSIHCCETPMCRAEQIWLVWCLRSPQRIRWPLFLMIQDKGIRLQSTCEIRNRYIPKLASPDKVRKTDIMLLSPSKNKNANTWPIQIQEQIKIRAWMQIQIQMLKNLWVPIGAL